MNEYDILIKAGNIIDGTGNPSYKADIGIKRGRIAKIGFNLDHDAIKEIDAKDQVSVPGFIDIHSHSDFALPYDNRLESTLRQGITTAVIGNCGDSLAPINGEKVEEFKKLVEIFSPPDSILNITWLTFEDYLVELEKTRCSTNLIPLVGFGTIRIAGGPGFESREPSANELSQMKLYVNDAMRAGAFGMSTGLIYSPQVYAKTSEIIALAKIVASYGGLYFSHIRGEGRTVVDAVKEFIEIVEKSGCRGGQIAHHKVAAPSHWGNSKKTLGLINDANTRGMDITCDQYPYDRGMTSLITLLPPWIHIGGMEKILERLQSSEDRARIREDITEGIEGWENWIKEVGFENIFISSVKTKKWKDIEGLNLREITSRKGYSDDFTSLFDLLSEEQGAVTMTIKSMGEEDIRRIMKDRHTMIGTDGWGVSPTGILGYGKPHPRFYGTYPRILGKFVRDKQLMTLETAIRKMTSFPSQKLGLFDRGLIREGMWADVVVFDPVTVIDRATYENPHQFSKGISHVIVNGVCVVENEVQNTELPGKVLQRPK